MVQLNVVLLTLAVGSVIPWLTALLVKDKAPAWLKALLNAALASIAGGVTLAIHTNGKVVLGQWAAGIAASFIASVIAYHGLWNPTGLLDKFVVLLARMGIKTTTGSLELILDGAENRFIAVLEGILAHLQSIPTTPTNVTNVVAVDPVLDPVEAEVVPDAGTEVDEPGVDVEPVADTVAESIQPTHPVEPVAEEPVIEPVVVVDPKDAALQQAKAAIEALEAVLQPA